MRAVTREARTARAHITIIVLPDADAMPPRCLFSAYAADAAAIIFDADDYTLFSPPPRQR